MPIFPTNIYSIGKTNSFKYQLKILKIYAVKYMTEFI